MVNPLKAARLAAQLAKEAREVAEKAAGFRKPRTLYNPENEIVKVPVKPIVAKIEEKKLRRSVPEPKETGKDFAIEQAKKFGLGSVSPQQKAAIEAQMNRGLRPDMPPLRINPLPPDAVNIRPPFAPGMRVWTPETKKVVAPMKPTLPKPQVFDIKTSGVAPKIPKPKDELPPIPRGAKDTEVKDSSGRLIFKKSPEEMGLKNFSDSTVRNSGTSVERTPGVFKERNWYENEEDAIKAFIARTKRESQGD